jgi:probable rRNA maturation factor
MELRIRIDAEEDPPGPFSPDVIGKLEGVFREELPLLFPGADEYSEVEVSASFLDRAGMRDVNKQFRGLDEATDVLAFPLWEEGGRFAPPAPFGLLPLGDVVICPEEAEQIHAPMPRLEALCLVLAHGFLHLVGWDHDTPEKEEIMWERQESLKLKLLNAIERGPST